MWMVRLSLPMPFALGIFKMNPLYIPCNYTMQKWLPFVPSEQNVKWFLRKSWTTFACSSTLVVSIYLLVFWIFPISQSRLETARWLTPNYLASCFLCLRIIFVQQCLQFHVFVFWQFPCSLSSFLSCVEITTFETPKPSFTRILRWSMFTISFSK